MDCLLANPVENVVPGQRPFVGQLSHDGPFKVLVEGFGAPPVAEGVGEERQGQIRRTGAAVAPIKASGAVFDDVGQHLKNSAVFDPDGRAGGGAGAVIGFHRLPPFRSMGDSVAGR
ncbi:hypothetical protein A7Q10_10635 [Methylacidiphilum caldifontis]|uniref:Uncharacterized protein n=1 Tax=Methylacidiphilum caldifontis TaxID=2795386 RepID=A0A4Y8PH13_9BACT|nr:hypothetical protein A7Q10_10635 [Methylacidiphilum caldifontis]